MALSNFVENVVQVIVGNYSSPIRNTIDEENSNVNALVLELNGSGARDQVPLYPISRQWECIVLYGPMERNLFPLKYNIILHVPETDNIFSLYRTDSEDEALKHFAQFKDCLTPLVKIDKRILDQSQLEKLSVVIRRNPGWTAVHLVAYFDLHEYYRHESLVSHINDQEGSLGKSPLHIAVEHGNLDTVNTLLSLNAEMDRKDVNLNTVIYQAVAFSNGSIVILKRLLEEAKIRSPKLKDLSNSEGYTPLYMASNQDSTEQVKDLKDESNPLHGSQTNDIITLLLDFGCDPNIVDNKGRSALHNVVRDMFLKVAEVGSGDMKSTLMLLCHECDPDLKDEEGNTPLHLAARLCSRHILQALIVFRANINTTNKRGHTARHLLCTSGRPDADQVLYYLDKAGAIRCAATQSDSGTRTECVPGCSATGTVVGSAPENCVLRREVQLMEEALNAFSIQEGLQKKECQNSESFKSGNSPLDQTVGGRLLTLDGGGIRGLVLIQMLLVIEEIVGFPIPQLFDWISGTSTGGILSLGLAVGKTVMQMQALYIRLKDTIFAGTKPYSAELMETFLKKEFGEELKMRDIRRHRVLITTTVVDTRPAEFHFFRNYPSPQSILKGNSEADPGLEEYVWRVAKWTGAAPSYFQLDGSRYVDGGLIANNPTLDALTELTQFGMAVNSNSAVGCLSQGRVEVPNLVMSLGCGVPPKEPVDPQSLDISWPRGVVDTYAALNKLPVMFNLLIDQATQSEGQVVERARAWCSSIGVPFYRFSPSCPKVIDLDETSDEVLVDLMWITRAYMLERQAKIEELGRILIRNSPITNVQQDN